MTNCFYALLSMSFFVCLFVFCLNFKHVQPNFSVDSLNQTRSPRDVSLRLLLGFTNLM